MSAPHQSDQPIPGSDSNLRARDESPPADRAYPTIRSGGTAERAYNTALPEQSRLQPPVEAAAASSSFTQPDADLGTHQLHRIWLEAHPPFASNQASNCHSTTLSRYLAGQYPLPLPQDLSRSIPSTLPPRVRMNMADHILRSSPGAAPQLFRWIEFRLRPLCPACSGDLTDWIYCEPDPAQQWRVYWAIYDAFEAGSAHGRQQHLDESNATRARTYVSSMGGWLDLDAANRAAGLGVSSR